MQRENIEVGVWFLVGMAGVVFVGISILAALTVRNIIEGRNDIASPAINVTSAQSQGQEEPPPPEEDLIVGEVRENPPPEPVSYPYISNISERSVQIYASGQELGNRPAVFSKVGDSITVTPNFLRPFGEGVYDLGPHGDLQLVIDYYSQETARTDNSFANQSLAAKGGWLTRNVLSPSQANETMCLPGESPLECEYRLVQPAVALIMLGTNDLYSEVPTGTYEENLREIVAITIDAGVIPVISTIPPLYIEPRFYGTAEIYNQVVKRVAEQFDIPLWDYYAALEPLPGYGLSSDGVHPSQTSAAILTPDPLSRSGMAVRNLTALQALDAIWRNVIQPGP